MLLTLTDVALRLGVSQPTARKIAKGLPVIYVGTRKRYNEDSVVEFAKSGRTAEQLAPKSNA